MTLSARRLNRATLARQLLLRREPLGVVEAVRRLVALQAQEAASPYLALWNRVAAFDPADLDAAFAEQAIVKATMMRITLHAVAADDHPVFHRAMRPILRGARLHDRRFAATGLSVADADDLVPHLLDFAARPRTNAEFEALLDERLGVLPKPGAWWALRASAPFLHAPTGGPWSFARRPSFVAARSRPYPDDRDEAVRTLVRRYLEGFGPASALDVARFTLLPRSTARDALRGLANSLETMEGPGGTEVFDVPGAPLPAEETPAPPRLLGMWDSVLLAYADRGRLLPPEYRRLVIRQNGDVLPTLLVDGFVAGVWRPVAGGIEATAFRPLSDDDWRGLDAEARSLVGFLAAREPAVYGRYGHWWAKLPGGEVRLLAATT